jgi:hypothetical protein
MDEKPLKTNKTMKNRGKTQITAGISVVMVNYY